MERTYTGKVFSLGDDTGYVVVGDTYYKFKATDLVRGDNLTCLSDRLCPNDDVEVLIGARGVSCVRPIGVDSNKRRTRKWSKVKYCAQCGKEKTENRSEQCPCTATRAKTGSLDCGDLEHREGKEQTQPRKFRQRSYSCVLDYGSQSYHRVSGLSASISSEPGQQSGVGRYMPRLGLSALRRLSPQNQPLRRSDYGGSQQNIPRDMVSLIDSYHSSANPRPQHQLTRRPRSNLASLASLTSAAVRRVPQGVGSERSLPSMRTLELEAIRRALTEDVDDFYFQQLSGSPSAATAGILRPSATRRRFNLLSYPIPPPFELQGRSYARPIPRGRALAPRSASSGRPSTVVHPSGPPPAVPNQLGEVRQATPSARSQRRDPRIARLIPASYANDNDYVSYGADSMELGSDLANCYLGGYYPSLAIRREQVRNARTAAAAAADPETIDNVRRRQTNIDWSDPLFRLITIVDRPSNMLN